MIANLHNLHRIVVVPKPMNGIPLKRGVMMSIDRRVLSSDPSYHIDASAHFGLVSRIGFDRSRLRGVTDLVR